MKASIHRIIRWLFTCIIAITIGTFNFSSAAAEPKRVALLPFKINSEKDLSFLRDGIYDMLSTRLSKEGQVEVLGRVNVEEAVKNVAGTETVTETTARSIGNQLNADFVLFGSLTVLGDSVSIDAKMVDVAATRPTMTFFDQSQDLGAVITKINLIAADINQKIFGQAAVAQKEVMPKPQSPPKETPKTGIHAHPEKVLQQEGYISQGQTDTDESPFLMAREAPEDEQKFWKSANFKHLINGISLGDVDGDGKIETVTITPHTVVIYRSEAGRFQQVQEISEGSKELTAVDIADINGNGYAEIFVTSLNANKNVLDSFVLEYDGKNYVKTINGSPWYYRVTNTPSRGRILLGQQPRMGKPYSGTIYEMIWQGDEYVPGEEIKTPRDTNLLGFAIGDVMNNDQEAAVAYKADDRMRVMDSSGSILWDGSELYGGSMLYYAGPDYGRDRNIVNKLYLPMRLLVWKDPSKKESVVIAAKNHDWSNMKLDYRKFTSSTIEAFTWDGIGLGPRWKTRKISGYISDISIGDFDNDGRDELIAAVVLKEGAVVLLTEPKSTIIAYELNTPEKPKS